MDGIKQLGKDQAAANELFDPLWQYGIFGVRNGEVESWLSDLGIRSKKAGWAVQMLERLGSYPNHAEYVKPTAADVWDFMRDVVKWIKGSGAQGYRLIHRATDLLSILLLRSGRRGALGQDRPCHSSRFNFRRPQYFVSTDHIPGWATRMRRQHWMKSSPFQLMPPSPSDCMRQTRNVPSSSGF